MILDSIFFWEPSSVTRSFNFVYVFSCVSFLFIFLSITRGTKFILFQVKRKAQILKASSSSHFELSCAELCLTSSTSFILHFIIIIFLSFLILFFFLVSLIFLRNYCNVTRKSPFFSFSSFFLFVSHLNLLNSLHFPFLFLQNLLTKNFIRPLTQQRSSSLVHPHFSLFSIVFCLSVFSSLLHFLPLYYNLITIRIAKPLPTAEKTGPRSVRL